jgi:hypothetical protein
MTDQFKSLLDAESRKGVPTPQTTPTAQTTTETL